MKKLATLALTVCALGAGAAEYGISIDSTTGALTFSPDLQAIIGAPPPPSGVYGFNVLFPPNTIDGSIEDTFFLQNPQQQNNHSEVAFGADFRSVGILTGVPLSAEEARNRLLGLAPVVLGLSGFEFTRCWGALIRAMRRVL